MRQCARLVDYGARLVLACRGGPGVLRDMGRGRWRASYLCPRGWRREGTQVGQRFACASIFASTRFQVWEGGRSIVCFVIYICSRVACAPIFASTRFRCGREGAALSALLLTFAHAGSELIDPPTHASRVLQNRVLHKARQSVRGRGTVNRKVTCRQAPFGAGPPMIR